MKNQHLLWYLEKKLRSKELTEDPWASEHHLPWKRETFLFVLTYVVHFCSNVEHCEFSPEIMALDQIAKSLHASYIKQQEDNVHEINNFSEMLVNSFIPNVLPGFFVVPKLHQLPVNDKHIKPNEILAGFIDFLLQVLYHGSEEKLYALTLLREQLSFLLAVLGDIPFQSSDHDLAEDVKNLLVEFEILANEAGTLVYDHVFHFHLVETSSFDARANALTKKFELLNARIKKHCIKFAELPLSVISRPGVVDSFFIIHSLVVDIESMMNSRLAITHDDFINDQIKTLHGELTLLQTYIHVSQVPNEHKEALIQIRDLAYEVEYLISSHVAGIMPVWYLNIRLLSLNQKLKLAHVGLQQNSEMHDSKAMSVSFDYNEVSFRRTEGPVTMDDSFFVDFNSDITQKILKELIGKKEEDNLIISIVGMPGIGKTTIAAQLYNCREVSTHFDVRVWCVVSETHSLRSMLIQILMCIPQTNLDTDTISEKSVEELGEDITEILRGKRYLILLDDVPDFNLLEAIDCFPDNKMGSSVLITTQMDVNSGHKVALLSDDQCWYLLEKKVFSNSRCPPQLVSIGKKIARRCSGIPLAIVSTADILVNLEKEKTVWESVEEQLDALLLDGQSNWKKKLELSYKRLPHYIKPCFLYFATFPKGAQISKNQLARMWIAQGYIHNDVWESEEETDEMYYEDMIRIAKVLIAKGGPDGGKWMSQEDTAEMYFSDMIRRALVLAAKSGTGGRIKAVKIHDLLHEFCVRKAAEENFHTSNNVFSMFKNHQHLSIPSASSISLRPFDVHCRSLRGCPTGQSSSFQTMPLLKVVDLYPKDYSSLLYPRFDLPIQLKYLSVSDLPKVMLVNLVNLESLYVRSNKTVVIPSVLPRMAKLRHFSVKPSAEFEEDCHISQTSNLRALSFIVFYRQKDVEIMKHFRHLKKLKCACGGDVIFPDMSFQRRLKSLKICFITGSRDIIEVPNFNFPETLKKLCLSGAVLTGEHMSIIGKLRFLEVLKLENHTFVEEVWAVSRREFEHLRVLKIESTSLRVWSCSEDTFVQLECLVVTGCTQLHKIPTHSYPFFGQLKRIEVMSCGPDVYLSLVKYREADVVTDENLEALQQIQCEFLSKFSKF